MIQMFRFRNRILANRAMYGNGWPVILLAAAALLCIFTHNQLQAQAPQEEEPYYPGNNPPINYEEEREIALSICEDYSITVDQVRRLGALEYSVRAAAQRELRAPLRVLQDDPSLRYCLLEKVRTAIAPWLSYARGGARPLPDSGIDFQMTHERTKGLELLQRSLESIASVDRYPARNWLPVDVFRPDDFVAAFKAREQWRRNGCNILEIDCSLDFIIPDSELFQLDYFRSPFVLREYFGNAPLKYCKALAENCQQAFWIDGPLLGPGDARILQILIPCSSNEYTLTEQVFSWGAFTGPFCRRNQASDDQQSQPEDCSSSEMGCDAEHYETPELDAELYLNDDVSLELPDEHEYDSSAYAYPSATPAPTKAGEAPAESEASDDSLRGMYGEHDSEAAAAYTE